MTPTHRRPSRLVSHSKGFPLNFPSTEVTSSSPEKGKTWVLEFTFDRVEIPWGKPSSSPEELAFLLGLFRTVLELWVGAACCDSCRWKSAKAGRVVAVSSCVDGVEGLGGKVRCGAKN